MLNRWMENIARLYVVYRFQLSNYFISQNKLYIVLYVWSMIVWAANASFNARLNLHWKHRIKKEREREREIYIYALSRAFRSFVLKALFCKARGKMGENVKSDLRSIFESVCEKMFPGKGNCWYKIAGGNHFERRLLADCKTTFSKKTLREDRWIEISNLIKIIPPTGVFLSFRRAEI